MEIIKVKTNVEGEPQENIEAIIFNLDSSLRQIVSLQDLSYLMDVSIPSLKNYIKEHSIPYWKIAGKWFVDLNQFFK